MSLLRQSGKASLGALHYFAKFIVQIGKINGFYDEAGLRTPGDRPLRPLWSRGRVAQVS